MPKKLRIPLIVVGVLLALVLGVGVWLLRSVHRVPDFYSKALAADPVRQKQASDEMLRRSAELRNNTVRAGQWQSVITADQINGWLAVDMVQNQPHLLPPEFHDPRVVIEPGQVTIGCRYSGSPMETILSLSADIYLQEPDVIGLRIRGARAGSLPLPLGDLTKRITQSLEDQHWRVTRREIDGDPLLLLSLPASNDARGNAVHLDKLELRDGELRLSGHTNPKR